MIPLISPTADLSASYQYFQKYMKGLVTVSFQIILKASLIIYYVVFKNHIVLSMHYLNYYNDGKKELDNGGIVNTILMNLPKAHNGIPHELLIAKLESYGLDKTSLRLILDYLPDYEQGTKIGSAFSSWCDTSTSVPQGSILRPLDFIVLISDFFLLQNLRFATLQMIISIQSEQESRKCILS